MVDATLVTVHGFWSRPATWDRLCAVWQADDELEGLRIHGFGYPSPRKPRLPFSWTRVPDFDNLAQMLAAEYATRLGKDTDIAFVTHSQGGLILQRFLAWMISEGRARELARIRTVIMLACPNGGSQYLASVRHAFGYGRHPQAANLDVLNKQITDTQRAVLTRIVHASGVDDHQCRIPFHVYAGGSDAIVPAASAQAAFPGAGTLAGNHFTILDPAAPGNRTADIVKHHILTDLPKGPPASVHEAASAIPAELAGHGQPGVSLPQAQGAEVGDRNVQYNGFSSPPVRPSDAVTPWDNPCAAEASMTPLKMELIDEEWVFVEDTLWVFAILVQVENKTDKAILVADSYFTNLDDGDRNTPLYQRYQDIWQEVRREIEYLVQAHLNDGHSGIFEPDIVFSPNRQEALWYVGEALPPEGGGGRPRFIFTMIDSLGNSYEMEIDRRPAKRFRMRTDADPEALPATSLCLASGVTAKKRGSREHTKAAIRLSTAGDRAHDRDIWYASSPAVRGCPAARHSI